MAYFVDAETAAVDYVNGDDGLLMAPTYAVPRLLARNGLRLQDFDFYEIHEAFASVVLAHLQAWESDEYCKERLGLDAALGAIDRTKLNVNGSSLAAGHPFAATGGRIVAQLAKQLAQMRAETGQPVRGLISICAAACASQIARGVARRPAMARGILAIDERAAALERDSAQLTVLSRVPAGPAPVRTAPGRRRYSAEPARAWKNPVCPPRYQPTSGRPQCSHSCITCWRGCTIRSATPRR